ncbi:MAG TPA: VOC family protein [Capsulimonadaceae bacterium]|jgi:catechol 2,3-dioxygenase-like lactoylglutathione lyase family enzyme
MQLKLRRVIYFCGDIEAMTRFYTDVMGFSLSTAEPSTPGEWVVLDTGAVSLCLHKAHHDGTVSGEDSNVKVVFDVADVAAARAEMIARGVSMGPHHHWGFLDASEGTDPEGNVFQLAGPPTPEN